MEMLTGLRALDTNRPSGEHNLVEYAKHSLTQKRKLKKIMDPRLEEQYPLKAALQAGELILKCLESDPRSRPSMEEVLEMLKKISAIKEKPKESKASTSQRKAKHQEEQQGHWNNHRSLVRSRQGGAGSRNTNNQRSSTARSHR